MNDYLAKPLRPEELVAALARACGEAGGGEVDVLRLLPAAGVRLDLEAAQRDIGDADLFATMVSMLLSEWDEHLDRLSKALAAKDAQLLRMHAHTLKSLLAMFHAEQARRQAMDIEHAVISAERADWTVCERLHGELAEEMKRLHPLLKQFVDTRLIP